MWQFSFCSAELLGAFRGNSVFSVMINILTLVTFSVHAVAGCCVHHSHAACDSQSKCNCSPSASVNDVHGSSDSSHSGNSACHSSHCHRNPFDQSEHANDCRTNHTKRSVKSASVVETFDRAVASPMPTSIPGGSHACDQGRCSYVAVKQAVAGTKRDTSPASFENAKSAETADANRRGGVAGCRRHYFTCGVSAISRCAQLGRWLV